MGLYFLYLESKVFEKIFLASFEEFGGEIDEWRNWGREKKEVIFVGFDETASAVAAVHVSSI